jgi:fatty acid desaturase
VVFFLAVPLSYLVISVQVLLTTILGRDINFDAEHPHHVRPYATFFLLYLQLALLTIFHGWWGFMLFMIKSGVCSEWYLTCAFVNHNSEAAWRLADRAEAKDWAEAQLCACSDIGQPGLPFYGSAMYLWLNYHSVHHVFPHTDMSKHPGIQSVMEDCCKDFGIKYCRGKSILVLYREMVQLFREPGDYLNLLMRCDM